MLPEDLFSPVNQEVVIHSNRDGQKSAPSACDFRESGVKSNNNSMTEEPTPERKFADEPDVISPKPIPSSVPE